MSEAQAKRILEQSAFRHITTAVLEEILSALTASDGGFDIIGQDTDPEGFEKNNRKDVGDYKWIWCIADQPYYSANSYREALIACIEYHED